MKPSYRPVRSGQTLTGLSVRKAAARQSADSATTDTAKRHIRVPHPVTLTEPDETLTEMNVPTVEFVIAGQEDKEPRPPIRQVSSPRTSSASQRAPVVRSAPPVASVASNPVHPVRPVQRECTAVSAPAQRVEKSAPVVHSRPAAASTAPASPVVQKSVPRSAADRSAARLYDMHEDERSSYSDASKRPVPVFLIIAGILMVVAIVFLILFFKVFFTYEKSRKSYETLNEQLTWTQDSAEGGTAAPSQLDFTGLIAQNPDTVAWLSMPGIEVSLPVVRNEDTAYYLTHGFDGTSNHNGCLFLPGWDKNNWTDGLHHVIYGHNIHDGTMFGRLTIYKDADFFASNPEFMLYTPEGDYRCLVFSVRAATDSDQNYIVDWQPGETYDAWLTDLKVNSMYDTGVDVPGGSQVITLSTCESTFAANDSRFVVHAVMQKLA